MKNAINTQASTNYGEIIFEGSLQVSHPAMTTMQELSGRVSKSTPTALDKLEVYKECHRLADDLYRLTGNKRIFASVIRIGDLLLSRIFSSKSHSLNVNQ
ncbi:MAG: hypothetical protein ACQES4_08340 [Bacillota bacterium]